MPIYHYHCGNSCKEFTKIRKISERMLAVKCPTCEQTAHRVLKAPFLNTMSRNKRIAHQHNERCADAPRVVKRPSGPVHNKHDGHRHKHRLSRPWMIGH